MSLQLWLPLNGTLQNNGLANINTPNNSVTFSTDSKIGTKSLKSSSKTIYNVEKENISSEHMTIAFWAKANANPGTSTLWWQLCTFTFTDASVFSIYCVPDARYKLEYKPELNLFCDTKVWHHVAYIINGNSISSYLDGEHVTTATSSNAIRTLSKISIGVNNVCINDFRVYDHCLSKKEVCEIAKGLILHYPLNNNGYGGRNLLLKSMGDIGGANYNVCTYKPETPMVVDQKYTLTVCVTAPEGVAYYRPYLSSGYQTLGNFTVPGPGTHIISKTVIGKYYSGKEPDKSMNHANLVFYRFPNDGSVTGTSIFHWAKLEIGETATAWSPNPADNSENQLLIEDASGYNYHGSATQLMNILSDSPKYNVSTVWKDNTDFISIPNFFDLNQTISEITICGWFKSNTFNSTSPPNLFNFGANSFIRGRIAGSSSLWSYWNINGTKTGVTATTGTTTDNNWHHYAFSFKDGIIKTYFDGVLKNTSDQSAVGTVLLCSQITDWGLGGYTPTGEKFIGQQSDFRTYITALSDEDILELFEGRPGVDSDGNFYIANLQENNIAAPAISKQNIAYVPGAFYEPTGMNLAYNKEPYDYTNVTLGYTPKANKTNDTINGFKVPYGAHLNGKRAQASVTVSWDGFDTSSTEGTFSLRFQGGQLTAAGGTSWTAASGKTNRLASAFYSAQSLTSLVLSQPSGSKTITVTYTISAVEEQPGDWLGIRADYSNGTGRIELSNIQVSLIDATVSDDQKFKISPKNIAANYIYEF